MCLQISQPVGVQSLSQNKTDWYGRDARYGVGRRECEYINPELQVCAFLYVCEILPRWARTLIENGLACLEVQLNQVVVLHAGAASLQVSK